MIFATIALLILLADIIGVILIILSPLVIPIGEVLRLAINYLLNYASF